MKLEGYALVLPLSAVRYTVKIAKDKNTDQKHTEKLIKNIARWIKQHSGKTKNELGPKLVLYIIIPYGSLRVLEKMRLRKLTMRIVGKWLAFDMYPEYAKEANEIVGFIQESLKSSLNVLFDSSARE